MDRSTAEAVRAELGGGIINDIYSDETWQFQVRRNVGVPSAENIEKYQELLGRGFSVRFSSNALPYLGSDLLIT
jgi:hypothetical protein